MIEKLIADGWEWVVQKEDGLYGVFTHAPILYNSEYVRNTGRYCLVPSCLFPDITFENSLVELKTLLIETPEEVIENIEEIRQALCDDYAVPRNLLFPEETPEEIMNRLLDNEIVSNNYKLGVMFNDNPIDAAFLQGYEAGLRTAQGMVTCAFHDKEM